MNASPTTTSVATSEQVTVADAIAALRAAAVAGDAAPMAAYMKDVAPFLGVKQPARRAASRDYLTYLRRARVSPADLMADVRRLVNLPEREYYYLAIDVIALSWKRFDTATMIGQIVPMIDHRPWWDTVDGLRIPLSYWVFQHRDSELVPLADRLLAGSFWQRRVAITLQLGWKEATDRDLLDRTIRANQSDREFFIQKAIGWALRDYSRTDLAWVAGYVEQRGITGLARREALKHAPQLAKS